MSYLFTSESVSEGHPDKVADQISDALVDHFLAFDPDSKVACETLVTTGQVVLAGEVPKVGRVLEHDSGWRLEVTAGDERRLTRLRLHAPMPEVPEED